MNSNIEEPRYITQEEEIIPNAFVINALVFNDEGKILLLKRKEDHKYYPGYWGLIMEKVKEEEPFTDALFRGIKEELSVVADDTQVRCMDRDLYKEWNGKEYQIRRYFVGIGDTEISLNSEHDEYIWFDREVSDTEEMNIMPDAIEMIEDFYNN